MRKLFFTYFFFAVYLLAMVKPMLPILDYYINYDYIVTQLCENRDKPILACNGKCYVAKEIEKNKTSDNQDTTVPEFKLDLYFADALDFQIIRSEIIPETKKCIPLSRNELLPNAISFSIFHPPRLNA